MQNHLQLKTVSYYNKNKRLFNKLYNSKWKTIAGPRYIGLCSYLFQEYYKTSSNPDLNDFADYYINKVNPIKSDNLKREDSIYYGRSIDELMNLAKYYQSMCDDTIPIEKYFDDIVNHAIVETYLGQIYELLLIKEYEDKGYSAIHTNGYWDKDLGVDFIIKNKAGIIKDYIQVKPISTFSGNNNKSLINDRINFFHKEEDKKKECKKMNYPYYPTKFVIYNTEYPNKWCSFNGKRGFLLEELVDSNGLIKINSKNFKYI